MRKILSLLVLVALATAAHAQQLVNCAPGTPCTLSGPSMTGTGDDAFLAFGKVNYNWLNIWLGATPQVAGGTVIGNANSSGASPMAISAVVLGSPTGGSQGAGTLNAQGLYVNGTPVPSYPQTPAEIAAGVTPVNYGYPPGNALRYGCVGDNSTLNDACIANAIAAAIASGGTRFVYFPSGVYKHASTISVPNQITIFGDGNWNFAGSLSGSVLIYTGTADQLRSLNPINSSTSANITVRDITLEALSETAGYANYDDVGSTFLYFDHVSFSSAAINMILDQSETVRVTNCLFQEVWMTGVWIVNGSEHTAGADADYTNDLLFEGNQFSGAATSGIVFIADDGGASHKIIANNFNEGATEIRVNDVSGLTFFANESESPLTNILDFETTKLGGDAGAASPQATISNNYLSVWTSANEINIAPGAITNLTVANNISYSTGGDSINGLTNAASSTVYGNSVVKGAAWPSSNLGINAGLGIMSSGVTCSMLAGITCTATVPSGSAHCAAYAEGSIAYYGACGISGTTATVTANASNSATWLVQATQ